MKLPAIRINPLGFLIILFAAVCLISLYATGFHKRSGNKGSTLSLKHLLAVGISVAEMGGSKVREIRLNTHLNQKSKGKTKEGANDPLTDGDLMSHRTMLHGLRRTFPNLKVVSEEHEDNQIEAQDNILPVAHWDAVLKITDDIEVPIENVLVWIDPLDATQEYTENLLEYVTTMVCVSVKGKPTIGIIHQPFKNITAWAWVDHGVSFVSSSNVKSEDEELKKSLKIIVSRSHAGKVESVAKTAFGKNTIVISAGGSGYKALQVAQGKADAYIHITLIKKWDICAGNALLSSLGGTMFTIDGQPIDYGDPNKVQNERGLIASLHNTEIFVEKLSGLKIE